MSACRRRKAIQRMWLALAGATIGVACSLIPSCQGALTTFNPCGTVFAFCQPYQLDALLGSVPDFNLDPTCTIPFFGITGTSTGTTGGGSTGTGNTGGVSGSCYNGIVYTNPGPRPPGQP